MQTVLTKAESLHDLYEHSEDLIRRVLHTKARFVRGHGNPDAEIVLVGEAPGLDEDRQGQPFVGRAGKLLNQWLASIGLARESVFISNVVKFHPMKNPDRPDIRGNDRPPKPAEIKACLPVIQQEISIIRPKIIVTLGNPATKTLLDTKESITALHGRFLALPAKSLFSDVDPRPSEEEMQLLSGIQVFPMFHPAATFHNPTLTEKIHQDLQSLKKAL